MNYPDKDNRTEEIINEILHIQSLTYVNWISALGRKLRVDSLHKELDDMGYCADRPPRQWSHLNVGKNKPE